MALVSLQNITVGFAEVLLDCVDLSIEEGEKICILGRNGSGKTTLMNILSGVLQPDSGELVRRQGIQISRLPQEIPAGLCGSIRELLSAGMKRAEEWSAEHLLERFLDELKIPGDAPFEIQSSGIKRRALLARALLADPDLLMLDEPTNHLDFESISWLEDFLKNHAKTLLLVTHDRQLVRSVSSRIVEIDLGRLFDWKCDYDTFLKRKDDALNAEAQQNRRFDKRLSEEEIWIRQGIKARRTRNEGRVKALMAMREERRKRRQTPAKASLTLQEGKRSGELVIRARNLSFDFDGKKLIENFSTEINRGDRIGILGPNGCGKSTLVRLLLAELKPARGTVEQGSNLQIIYYDQQRQVLDEHLSVWENVTGGNDYVVINGIKQHVVGYLQRFLFNPERIREPVGSLSGGEKGRLMLARLFTQPCNLLVLDEPTNDLDIETLELLEELLLEFRGTLLLISHDRTFINDVVTSTMVFESSGIHEYIGGYEDWQRQRPRDGTIGKKIKKTVSKQVREPGKLSNREERILASLPGEIEGLEEERGNVVALMSQPEFYRRDAQDIVNSNNRLKEIEEEIERAYALWQELEDRRQAFCKS